MSEASKTPRNVARIAARYESSGYISSSQYAELEYAEIVSCKEFARALEARHAEGLAPLQNITRHLNKFHQGDFHAGEDVDRVAIRLLQELVTTRTAIENAKREAYEDAVSTIILKGRPAAVAELREKAGKR